MPVFKKIALRLLSYGSKEGAYDFGGGGLSGVGGLPPTFAVISGLYLTSRIRSTVFCAFVWHTHTDRMTLMSLFCDYALPRIVD